MFPRLADHPRWHQHRKIVIHRRWLVLYRVATVADGAEPQVYVTDIVPARSDY